MKKRVFSILLVLAMVASMLPLTVFNVSALGLADFYTNIRIGDNVYDVETMPGNLNGDGYFITSTGLTELVIELRNYNGGPIYVDSTSPLVNGQIVCPKIVVKGNCVINVPNGYDGYGIEYYSVHAAPLMDIEFNDGDASLTIQGGDGGNGGAVKVSGNTNVQAEPNLDVTGPVGSSFKVNMTSGEGVVVCDSSENYTFEDGKVTFGSDVNVQILVPLKQYAVHATNLACMGTYVKKPGAVGDNYYVDKTSSYADGYGVLWLNKVAIDSPDSWYEPSEPGSSVAVQNDNQTNVNTLDLLEGIYYEGNVIGRFSPFSGYMDSDFLYNSDDNKMFRVGYDTVDIDLYNLKVYDIVNQCYVETQDRFFAMKLLPAGMYIQEYCYDTYCTGILRDYAYIGFLTEEGKLDLTLDGQTIQRGDALNHVPGTYRSIADTTRGVATPELGKGIQVNSPVYYIYDVKPVINSVTVNGQGGAYNNNYVVNKGNVTIATNYDGLSQALKDCGCSVKQLAAYYLNGEKINVAMINPVDNGDGTYTKSYTRTLNPGDELRVESWLEVRWPDGSTDRVDENTVTVSRPTVAFDFANQNPVGSADETTGLTAKSGDTKSYTFSSTAVPSGYYVEKKATLKGLFAGLDADQTVTVKDGSAATLTHTFINPGLYQLTETLKLYENGSTKAIATKSHVFLIEVAAADPAFVTQPHYAGQGMQMGTNYVSWKLNFTPVKLIARCNTGTHARPNWKEYELDPTKSLAALVAYSQNYVLYAYYGEGDRDYVASDAFSAEKPAEFTPAFTKQPVGDESLGGNPVEVTWATNFTPVKISIMQGSVKPTMEHSVLDDATATSTLLGASENNYFICAYYSDTEYVTSNKFQITELEPAFTLQPADGVSLGGAYSETTWATNFTPVKLQLVKYDKGPTSRPFYAYEDLDVDATYCTVEPGHDYYCIRAYYNDTEYVDSERFIVTEMNYYNAWFYVDDTVLDKVMVLEGDYVERPADPIKDGYTFDGWYTDDGEAYNFAAPVTDDVHLTAWFEQNESEYIDTIHIEGLSAPQYGQVVKDLYKVLEVAWETGTFKYSNADKLVCDDWDFQDSNHQHYAWDSTDTVAEGFYYWAIYFNRKDGYAFADDLTVTVDGVNNANIAIEYDGDDWAIVYVKYEVTNPAEPPVGAIPGDVNEDGKVNIRDLGLVQQSLNGWNVTLNTDAADVNNDGKVNIRDLGLIQQYLNGWNVELQ